MPIFALKAVFDMLLPEPGSVPNFKFLLSMVAEYTSGSQNFWYVPLGQTPANFCYSSVIDLLLTEPKLYYPIWKC